MEKKAAAATLPAIVSVPVFGVSLEIGNFCTLSAFFNQSRCVTD